MVTLFTIHLRTRAAVRGKKAFEQQALGEQQAFGLYVKGGEFHNYLKKKSDSAIVERNTTTIQTVIV